MFLFAADTVTFKRDRQVGELSVVSYCSELASGELQDLEFSKSCRQDLEFSKFCMQDFEIFQILYARFLKYKVQVCVCFVT